MDYWLQSEHCLLSRTNFFVWTDFWFNAFPLILSDLLSIEGVYSYVWSFLDCDISRHLFVMLALDGCYRICAMSKGVLKRMNNLRRPESKCEDCTSTHHGFVEVVDIFAYFAGGCREMDLPRDTGEKMPGADLIWGVFPINVRADSDKHPNS